MYSLYICEKPSQGSMLAQVLGATKNEEGYKTNSAGDVIVTWCIGHLLELYEPEDYNPTLKKWAMKDLPIIPNEYKYKPKDDTKKQLNIVAKLMKNAETIIISTDFDNEGEAIGRNLINYANFQGPIKRLCLTALDEKSIRKALLEIKNGSDTINLYFAALARAKADWVVGMNLSRLFTILNRKKIEGVLSVGRVMTPTIFLVYERDQEIKNFVSKPFYNLYLDLVAGNQTYKVKFFPKEEYTDESDRVLDRNYLEQIINKLKNKKATVEEYTSKQQKQSPPLPFDLSNLQQYCNKAFGYSAQNTLKIAQSLYEKHRATSYPRTDSRYIPETQFSECADIIKNLKIQETDSLKEFWYDNVDLSLKAKAFNTSKVTAHHAIIPTGRENLDLSEMSEEELNVYNVIKRSYIALFYRSATFECNCITLSCESENMGATTRFMTDAGWKVLFGNEDYLQNDEKQENEDNNELLQQKIPNSQIGALHTIKNAEIKDSMTKPPAHFTESTLLYAMNHISKYIKEEKFKVAGLKIGTAATQAGIIDSAKKNKYISTKGKQLLATEKAEQMIKVIPQELQSASMTAIWEKSLEQIAKGNLSEEQFTSFIEKWIRGIVDAQKCDYTELENDIISNDEDLSDLTIPVCPNCGQKMVLRNGKNGRFFGCSAYPKCKGIVNVEKNM